MSKILIVGAGGFIGSHLRGFLSREHEIYTCSRSGVSNDKHFSIDPDAPDFTTVFASVRPDVCINCSGAANVSASFEAPLPDFALNVTRVVQLLDAIRQANTQTRFLHMSSAAVYGNPLVQPVDEAAGLAPLSPYGHHKHLAEIVCAEYSQLFSVPTLSMRIFSAYGPGLRKQIFWDIFQKWQSSGQVNLFGTGMESRDFIFIYDLCQAVECILSGGKFDGGAINVASGKSVAIRDAANILLTELGASSKAEFSGDERKGDPSQWRADIRQLSSYGFVPRNDITSGLRETAKWLKDQV